MHHSVKPSQAGSRWTTRAGLDVLIRPIRGDDEELMACFHRTLSPESVYTRYFNVLKLSERIAHKRLDRVCHPPTREESVLVVERVVPGSSECEIIGVGRLSAPPDTSTGEVAIIVSDAYQRQGIGSRLLRRLRDIAEEKQLSRLRADILSTNAVMLRVCSNAGMHLVGRTDAAEMRAEIDI